MKKIFILLILFWFTNKIYSQEIPLNAKVQNRFNELSLDADTGVFTGFRSMNWLEVKNYLEKYKTDVSDSIFGLAPISGTDYRNSPWRNFLKAQLLRNNWVQTSDEENIFAIDPYVQAAAGVSNGDSKLLLQGSLGLRVQGVHFNNTLSYTFALSADYNKFPDYINSNIDSNQNYIPGIGKGYKTGKDAFTSTQINANITYLAGKHFLVSAGYGKNFIGDGYRSLILSDNAANYPYLRLQGRIWRLTYNVLYNKFENPRFQVDGENQRKYSVMHYLGINFSNKFQMGIYDNNIWLAKDTNNQRGFDVQYINPIIFMRPLEFAVGSPDNALLGLTFKYQFYKKGFLYGQIYLDDLHIKETLKSNSQHFGNKYGLQFGIWNQDVFQVKNLSYRLEWNGVRPYMYGHGFDKIGLNYTHKNQILTDPFNANFHEFISIINYHNKRFYAVLENLFTIRGENHDLAYNNGEDLWRNQDSIPEFGSKTLQGIKHKYFYNQLSVGYLINPKNGLSLQADAVYRKHNAPGISKSDFYFLVGLRTNLYNFYHDF